MRSLYCLRSKKTSLILALLCVVSLSVWLVSSIPLGRDAFQHDKRTRNIAFSSDGHLLASVGANDGIRVWNFETAMQLAHIDQPNTTLYGNPLFSSTGQLLIYSVHCPKPAVQACDSTGNLSWTLEFPAPVKSLAISPGDDLLAVGLQDFPSKERVAILRVADRSRVYTVNDSEYDKDVTTMCFLPKGDLLAIAGASDVVLLVNYSRNEVAGRLKTGNRVEKVVSSPNGELLVAAIRQHEIPTMWDVDTGADLVAQDTRPSIIGWSIPSMDTVDLSIPFSRGVYDVTFSPDGNILAWSSDPDMICRYDLAQRKMLPYLKVGPFESTLHSGFDRKVAFSPDGCKLVVSGDRTLHVWDLSTGTRIQ